MCPPNCQPPALVSKRLASRATSCLEHAPGKLGGTYPGSMPKPYPSRASDNPTPSGNIRTLFVSSALLYEQMDAWPIPAFHHSQNARLDTSLARLALLLCKPIGSHALLSESMVRPQNPALTPFPPPFHPEISEHDLSPDPLPVCLPVCNPCLSVCPLPQKLLLMLSVWNPRCLSACLSATPVYLSVRYLKSCC